MEITATEHQQITVICTQTQGKSRHKLTEKHLAVGGKNIGSGEVKILHDGGNYELC